MKAQIKAIFDALPVNVRAAFYSNYLALCNAADAGDYAVFPYLLAIPNQQQVSELNSELLQTTIAKILALKP